MTEYEFDEQTIKILEEQEKQFRLLAKAMPIIDKLSDKELDLLDRLIGPTKGILTSKRQNLGDVE